MARLFDPRNREISEHQARRYAMFEALHTTVDFLAAFLFVIGSVLFFFPELQTAGTIGFLVGSLFFAAKPSIRLSREVWLARSGYVGNLAQKAPEAPKLFDRPSAEDPSNQQDPGTDDNKSGS